MATKLVDMQTISLAFKSVKDGWVDPLTADDRAQVEIIAKHTYQYWELAHRMIGRPKAPKVVKWELLPEGQKNLWRDTIACMLQYQETALTTALAEFPI